MRFETLEPRLVLTPLLGGTTELALNATATQPRTVFNPPADIQFRDSRDDFAYSSQDLDSETIDALMAATAQWNEEPEARGQFEFESGHSWQKLVRHHAPTVSSSGVIVTQRSADDTNSHTLVVSRRDDSACFHTAGSYTHQDYHYLISFDVRHPVSELPWLVNHDWGIVMQLWGPRESNETPRTPPFAIYSTSVDGVPHWTIRSYGDARRTTHTGQFEEVHSTHVPMTNIGQWQRFDVEIVPNPFGEGLIRTWLNGELIAEWKDIKNIYYSVFDDQPTGPLNPGFGLYTTAEVDGMEVHHDNISIQCNGVYQSSISGALSGGGTRQDHVVYATNRWTGERYGTYTRSSGVYSLAVPPGIYTVTAINAQTGEEFVQSQVSTLFGSQRVDLHIAPAQTATLTGDVTGDGKSEIVNRLPDGGWEVTVVNDDGSQTTSRWGHWSTNVQWTEMQLADVTGDGRQDIVGRVADGNWWVAESTGDRFFNRHWGKWSTSVDWSELLVGDFNGDGRDDLAARESRFGTWWVGASAGTHFLTSRWGSWSTSVDWTSTLVGDFNGDGKMDIAGRVANHGSWWLAVSHGTGFYNQQWGHWSNRVEWHDVSVGDFNGDGRNDLVGRTDDGQWWVSHSNGHRFLNSLWGRWVAFVDWSHVHVADVDGDGRSDLVGRASLGGSWWTAKSTGTRFLNQAWGATWSMDEDWLVASVGDFDGDGVADLLGATDSRWWLAH